MCALCGSLGATDWTDGVAPDSQSVAAHDRRGARRARAAAASRVLRTVGMTLEDWQGSAFLLRGRTGACIPVNGLLDLWAAADKLAAQNIDPLDPALIARLDR